jgi:uncharacterized protein (TIGR03000 family)
MKPAEDKKQSSANRGAKLIVDLPPDAKLFIDDQPMKINSQHPIFATPKLEDGKTYFYEVRAEVVRDGKVLTDTKRVEFHAGDELRESFTALAPATMEKVAAGAKN